MTTGRRRQQRGPVRTLNALVVLTLVTVTLALAYLGYYYVGAANQRTATWFAPGLLCRPLLAPCETFLGRSGHMKATWRRAIGRDGIEVRVNVSGLAVQSGVLTVSHTLENDRVRSAALTPLADGSYRGEVPLARCRGESMPLRGRIMLNTDRGRLGSWYDFSLACSAMR
ncbi:hypothetical protein [Kushneria aurantia]|uniref:Uncharacterized protein n=1 Tax=Kushneria aurantia TaxID=504092 RepID=A0ABV6G221_9GAMM|nr:hypothetical protein [Kushneria aurantia]